MLDQTGYRLSLSGTPQRIISLVPSQSELLFHLGLGERVIGITKFCIHPEEWFREKTRIGGTKKVDLDKIRSLQPDLILGNKEENLLADIEALRQEFPVWMSDIVTLGDATDMIRSVGQMTEKSIESEQIAGEIEFAFSELMLTTKKPRPLRIGYLIWDHPLMAAGNNTFINSMIRACGWVNCFAQLDRYPQINQDMIRDAAPDVLMLSSEPYPFKEDHLFQFQTQLKDCTCLIVDGECFSWYGSRLLHAPRYFTTLKAQILQLKGMQDSAE